MGKSFADVVMQKPVEAPDIAAGVSSGVKAGIDLATAADQVEQKKAQTEAMKADLIVKQASTANSLLTNLARANPSIAKKMLPKIRERLISLGADPDIADYTISDDANRQRQVAFSAYAGSKLTSDPKVASEYFSTLGDVLGYDNVAQLFDSEQKRKQQDKQFAIQEKRLQTAQNKQDERMKREDEKIARQESQALSKRLESDSLPEVTNALNTIDKLSDGIYSEEGKAKLDKIANLKGFAASMRVPFTNFQPFAEGAIDKEDMPLYQAVAALRNSALKLRSGGAVTDPEALRFLEELGQGSIKSGEALQNGLRVLNESIKNKVKTIEVGFMPETVDMLKSRGNQVSSANMPGPKSPKGADPVAAFKKFLDSKGLTPEQKQKALEAFMAKQQSE